MSGRPGPIPSEGATGNSRARIFLLNVSEVGDGEIKRVEVDGYPAIAVFNREGKFYATEDKCSHGDASLSDGEIDGDDVVCPYHAGAFCIATGEATRSPCWEPIKVFEVFIADEAVYCCADD